MNQPEAGEGVEVLTLEAGGDGNFAYLLLPSGGGEAWCVDPSFGAAAVAAACEERGRRLGHILLTHSHGDHTAGVEPLRASYPCRVWCHPAEADRVPGSTPLTGEGPLGEIAPVEVLYTPGHTPGSTCFKIPGHIFTGDTLFVDWVGRADFEGGDPAELFASLGKLRALPGGLRIHPGHDYGEAPSRLLSEEVVKNRFFACTDFGIFLKLLPELAE